MSGGYTFGKGRCPRCGTIRPLRQDGRLISHRRSSDRKRCAGHGELPQPEMNEDTS